MNYSFFFLLILNIIAIKIKKDEIYGIISKNNKMEIQNLR